MSSQSTALLTEHFRFTPLTLLDDIINTVNELVFRSINGIEEGLGSATPEQLGFRLDDAKGAYNSDEKTRRDALAHMKQAEIDSGVVQLESLLNATVDRDFDKFEIYSLRNILSVGHEEEDLSAWVRLNHYAGVDVASTEGVVSPEDIQTQRRKLKETAKLNVMLKAEEIKNDAILKQLSSMFGSDTNAPLAFLSPSHHDRSGSASLSQNAQYASSQLPALQELLSQLKDTLFSTSETLHGQHDAEDSTGIKRRQYLNSESRHALERRGIEPDSSIPASLLARKVATQDEIEGIEAIARALATTADVDKRPGKAEA